MSARSLSASTTSNTRTFILREKVDLDITWIADEFVESADNLPDPMLLAEEIAAELEATLADFAEIGASLRARSVVSTDTVHGG